MNEMVMLRKADQREILQTIIEKKVPAIMSYLSKNKWHVAKVLLDSLGATRLNIEVSANNGRHPVNVQVDQPVGIAVKYGYGKFIFETSVEALEPSQEPGGRGIIVVKVPERIEIVQRRSYFRVDVPSGLKVNVTMWRRGNKPDESNSLPGQYWQGRLIDISAGGAQIAIDAEYKGDFRNGQFIGMRFTPMPYEMPLMFDAQIRNILPTADNKNACLGLQIVGLEASPEGRQVLSRLVHVVENYYQINQSGARQQDIQGTSTENRRVGA